MKINTTLVVSPLFNAQTLYLQINAAPYIVGESSGYLNPHEVLIKSNSSKIQIQAHKLLFKKIVETFLRIKGEIFV